MRSFVLSIGFVATLVLAAGCGVERRSGEFVCEVETDCPADRTCDQGFCVYRPGFEPDAAVDAAGTVDAGAVADGGGGTSDAALPVVDASLVDAPPCDPSCTSCNGTLCIITCNSPDSCASVTCPAGLDCRVDCTAAGSCAAVDCGLATSCDVNCGGSGSCATQVKCNTNACDVACTGVSSCAGGVDCDQSCQCDTSCLSGTCGPMLCLPASQCTAGGVCRSGPGPCQLCN